MEQLVCDKCESLYIGLKCPNKRCIKPSQSSPIKRKTLSIPLSPPKIEPERNNQITLEYQPKIYIKESKQYILKHDNLIQETTLCQVYNLSKNPIEIIYSNGQIIGSDLIIVNKGLVLEIESAVCFVSYHKQWNKCNFS